MSDLTLYLAQINQFWEDKAQNKAHIQDLLNQTDLSENGLLILPEMFNTGFTTNAEKFAEEWTNSPSIEWLKELSKENKIAINTSLIILENYEYFNRSVFIADGKLMHHYNKNYLFSLAGETKTFTAGTENNIVYYYGWNILPLICYDLRFPELSRISLDNKGQTKYDLLIYIANWPKKRAVHWNKLLEARAIENLSYCVGVNRVGIDGNQLEYNGCSKVVSPMGEAVLTFPDGEEGIKEIKIEKEFLMKTRKAFGFLKDIK